MDQLNLLLEILPHQFDDARSYEKKLSIFGLLFLLRKHRKISSVFSFPPLRVSQVKAYLCSILFHQAGQKMDIYSRSKIYFKSIYYLFHNLMEYHMLFEILFIWQHLRAFVTRKNLFNRKKPFT